MIARAKLFGRALCAVLAAAAAGACEGQRQGTSDELTIVVQADKRELEQAEKAIKSREEALKNEQGQLDQRINELAASRAAADLEHRRRLDEELITAKAAQDELTRRVTVLQQQKVAMEVQRTVLSAPGAQGDASALSVREAMVAAREAKLATRENLLAAREAELAAREKQIAARETGSGKEAGAVQAVARDPAAQRDVPTRAAVEARHRKVLADLTSHGILISDLLPEDQPLNAEIWNARRSGDFAHAGDLLAELSRAVAHLKIDQRFVEAKMVRLQGLRGGAKLEGDQRAEVERMLREVTSAYSDGQYDRANRGLNRIAAILDASHASG